jgi:hypothetical protein
MNNVIYAVFLFLPLAALNCSISKTLIIIMMRYLHTNYYVCFDRSSIEG